MRGKIKTTRLSHVQRLFLFVFTTLCQLLCSLLLDFLVHEYGIFLSFLLSDCYLYNFLLMLPVFLAGINMFRHSFQGHILVFYTFYLLHIICIISCLKFFQSYFHIRAHMSNLTLSEVNKFKVFSNLPENDSFLVVLPANLLLWNIFAFVPQIFSL